MDPGAYWQLTATGRADVWAELPIALWLFLPFLVSNLLLVQPIVKDLQLTVLLSLYSYGCSVPFLYGTDLFFYGGDVMHLQPFLIGALIPTIVVTTRAARENRMGWRSTVAGLLQLIPDLLVAHWYFL